MYIQKHICTSTHNALKANKYFMEITHLICSNMKLCECVFDAYSIHYFAVKWAVRNHKTKVWTVSGHHHWGQHEQKKNVVESISGQTSFLLRTPNICESLFLAGIMILFIHYTCCGRHIVMWVNGLISHTANHDRLHDGNAVLMNSNCRV